MNDDDRFFLRALQEFRDSSSDDRDFSDLPAEVQQAILHHAQQLKKRAEEEKRG